MDASHILWKSRKFPEITFDKSILGRTKLFWEFLEGRIKLSGEIDKICKIDGKIDKIVKSTDFGRIAKSILFYQQVHFLVAHFWPGWSMKPGMTIIN